MRAGILAATAPDPLTVRDKASSPGLCPSPGAARTAEDGRGPEPARPEGKERNSFNASVLIPCPGMK
jgi:hypothetical protein